MSARGVITTFYSYKGGTGRTMALANVAWILASNGKRVLVLDWDLEAPGLHTYFAPFLKDAHARESSGLLDWIYEYLVAVTEPGEEGEGTDWIRPYTALDRFAVPIDWQFAEGGCLHLVSAGRQDSRYAERVNRFDWRRFYDDFGGAAFIDRTLAELRLHYDHILIDSRTGVSDTSGICTVQAPDQLVVLFTLNNQSIDGATEIVRSVVSARPKIKVVPVMSRVELNEDERMKARQALARQRFGEFIGQADPVAYMGKLQIQYVPYYAYEEVLAAVRELPNSAHPILSSFLALTGEVSAGKVTTLPEQTPAKRESGLAVYANATGIPASGGAALATVTTSSVDANPGSQRWDVFISYPLPLGRQAEALYLHLSDRCNVFMAPRSVPAGVKVNEFIAKVLRDCKVHVILIGKVKPRLSGWYSREVDWSLEYVATDEQRLIAPMLLDGATIPTTSFLSVLRRYQATELRTGEEGGAADKILRLLGLASEGKAHTTRERAILAEDRADQARKQLSLLTLRTRLAIAALVAVGGAWGVSAGLAYAERARLAADDARKAERRAATVEFERQRQAVRLSALTEEVTGLFADAGALRESVRALQLTAESKNTQFAAVAPLLDDAKAQSQKLTEKVEQLRAPVLRQIPELEPKLSETSSTLRAIDTTILQVANDPGEPKPPTRTLRAQAQEAWQAGYAKASLGDYAGAEKLYEKAHNLDSHYAPVLNSLGVLDLSRNDTHQAGIWFDKAIAADPDYAPAHYNRALAYQAEQQLDKARESARTALIKRPGYAPAARVLAEIDEAVQKHTPEGFDPKMQALPP